jgi:anthranilate synthase component 2
MLYLIDNYDSFTYNLVHMLGALGCLPRVVKNDDASLSHGDTSLGPAPEPPTGFVLSPGPGGPSESGVCLDVLRRYGGTLPIFGVCLGHQAIAHAFGGRVIRAQRVKHGKVSEVHHDGAGVFRGLKSPIVAGRYHSLVVDPERLPAGLRVTAWTASPSGQMGEIMGIRHAHWPIEGIQFHPESVLTPEGGAILRNFCDILGAWTAKAQTAKAQRPSKADLHEAPSVRADPSDGESSAAET